MLTGVGDGRAERHRGPRRAAKENETEDCG